MANVITEQVTLKSIIGSLAFGKGFRDAREGRPLASDEFKLKDVWHYERGRQFAFCYDGRLKEGRRLRLDALFAFKHAMRVGHII